MPETDIRTEPREPRWRRVSMDQSPPFSVRMLFGLSMYSAIHLAVVKRIAPAEISELGAMRVIWQALLLGLSFLGTALICHRWWRGRHWPIQPGHWLLFAIGVAAGGQLAAELFNAQLPQSVLQTQGIYLGLIALGLLPPLLVRRMEFYWRAASAGLLGGVLLKMLFAMGFLRVAGEHLDVAIAAATVILFGLAVWQDPQRWRRSWLHWSGLAVWVMAKTMPPILPLVVRWIG